MSFYTSLTGLNAATTELSVTSNNIANSGTSGFKRSDADFGDIFATSPLQKASSVIGRGVSLKEVSRNSVRVTLNSQQTRWIWRLPVTVSSPSSHLMAPRSIHVTVPLC